MVRLRIGSLWLALAGTALGALPGAYYPMLETGVARVEARLNAEPAATLRTIEEQTGWRHFPHALLAVAVLHQRDHAPRQLALARRIADLCITADEAGLYYWRLDSYWDTYMWLESYRLLERDLTPPERTRWRRTLERNVAMIATRSAEWRDFPAYTASYIGTSTNHYALWAVNLMLAGRLFSNHEWQALGEHILHRLAAEQAPAGYWGEYSATGPTTGYNLLTLAAVGVYQAHTKDPTALEALRRATAFHANCTWPDTQPVELFNDRNRHWDLNLYGNFAFSRTPQGRRLAEFFFDHFPPERLDIEALGRIAQNALYYSSGPLETLPFEHDGYRHRLDGTAGIEKSGPWIWALSGLMATTPATNQWILDRQSHLALFRKNLGLILSGANSKKQPELATFNETIGGTTHFLPLEGRLTDRLWLSFNTFFASLAAAPDGDAWKLTCRVTGRGAAPESARFALQLVLHPGEMLETGSGLRVTLGRDPVHTTIGRVVRHHGWTLETAANATLTWPVFPYNPYRNGPDTKLENAVGLLTIPLELKPEKDRFVRPDEQIIEIRLH